MPHEQETAPGAAADDAEALKQERDELQDRLLRSAAEFDNYRKRTERERRELSDAVSADVIRDLLPVVDDLERALAAAADSPDKALRSGVELIHRQLLEAMRRRGGHRPARLPALRARPDRNPRRPFRMTLLRGGAWLRAAGDG